MLEVDVNLCVATVSLLQCYPNANVLLVTDIDCVKVTSGFRVIMVNTTPKHLLCLRL